MNRAIESTTGYGSICPVLYRLYIGAFNIKFAAIYCKVAYFVILNGYAGR